MERCVLYARISFDRAGEQIGVQRQLRALRQLAERQDYDVVAEAVDNDISAMNGARRPGFEQVWELVRGGRVDHVLVWQTSRLMRSRSDRAQVIAEFGEHRVDIIAAKGPSLDLRTAYGRGTADLMTAFDSLESEVKAERVAAAIGDLARRGKSWGFCPYGWDRTGRGIHAKQTPNPHEAAIIAELVDRLLAGESLNELYRDMNARGEPAPARSLWDKLPEEVQEQRRAKGRKVPPHAWAKSTVRTLVVRDCNAGIRTRGADGAVQLGDWDPIVDREKHERVLALLSAPERRSHSGPRPGARRHLLTNGIGKCGVCGDLLRVAQRTGRKTNPHIYMCRGRGCTGRVQSKVDAFVADVVIERLAQPDALDWLIGDDEAAQRAAGRVEALQRRLDDAADSYADDKINARQLERITARLMPELEEARRERDAAVRSLDFEVLRPLAGDEAVARWEAMPVSSRRAVLATLGVEVTLLPRKLNGPGFEYDTVKITWRREPS